MTLTRKFTADKYPEGGHPIDKTHFNRFSFSLSVPDLSTSKYYDIDVRLTSTKYKGYAANFGATTSSDLKFHADDNTDWTLLAADHLQYKWKTDPNMQSVPGTITVRCYDWGANGSVAVTIEKRGDAAYTLTKTVPYDEANKNGIADQWEKDNNIYIADETEAQTKAVEDEEVAPDATNKNNGDGWTNYDEYRGIFTEKTDTAVTRLSV